MITIYRILPVLAALSLCSCMTFEQEWSQAVSAYQSGKTASPEGPWIGDWTTVTNGHEGDLRAIVSKSKSKPDEYEFRYHATWKKILSGSYKVSFPVRKRGSSYLVDGGKDLGLFGDFGHKATITGNTFKATYSNDREELGEFRMTRPE
ncbi:MAG: hypothetical protein P1U86_02960 [Verrucomicrobiales bacterium]|nr:hypothetical protein [Verrucomicrobiales bacterium]